MFPRLGDHQANPNAVKNKQLADNMQIHDVNLLVPLG